MLLISSKVTTYRFKFNNTLYIDYWFSNQRCWPISATSRAPNIQSLLPNRDSNVYEGSFYSVSSTNYVAFYFTFSLAKVALSRHSPAELDVSN